MPERITREKGIVVTVRFPIELAREIDHFLIDLPRIPGLLGGRRNRSTLIQHLLRYALTHQEETLDGWKPPRGNRGKRPPSPSV